MDVVWWHVEVESLGAGVEFAGPDILKASTVGRRTHHLNDVARTRRLFVSSLMNSVTD